MTQHDITIKIQDKSQSLGFPEFRLATATTHIADTSDAMRTLEEQIALGTYGAPDFMTIHYGSDRAPLPVWEQIRHLFGSTAVHGGSSCLGVMSAKGANIESRNAIGVLAIWDPHGAYGTAAEPLSSDTRTTAARATRKALRKAGRPGEAPDLIWLTGAPGHEEAILEGIKDVIGRPALIVGASSADNDVAGGWSQITEEGPTSASVVVTVMFPSVPFACAFESGYAPTDKHGMVTRANGRVLAEIDGRPAAKVYAEWTGLPVVPEAGSISILAEASFFPLARVSSEIDSIPFHILSHPAFAHADGTLELFADVSEGQEIWLMSGSKQSLVQRAARIAAASRAQLPDEIVAGGLVVYCGGCMLTVKNLMDDVAGGIAEALDHAPFLGVFSFGEQGETFCGDSEHGNLMISCTTFGSGVKRSQAGKAKV